MRNRGKHPNDDKIFSHKCIQILKTASQDLSFLQERGYGDRAAIALVGNRYRLNKRQQMALMRMSCASSTAQSRISKTLLPSALKGQKIYIDGFNLLILLEVGLSAGYIFEGMDQRWRDIASIHGSYKRVEQTHNSLQLIGEYLEDLQVLEAKWYFDAPVSNSGRLKTLLYEIAQKNNFPWEIELVNNPDKVLVEHKSIIISNDGWVVDHSTHSFDLGKFILTQEKKTSSCVFF